MIEREEDIISAIAIGHKKTRICIDLAKKYNVSDRTIENTYYAVCKSLHVDYLQNREEVASVVYSRKDEIYRRCMEERKYKTALDAVVAIGRMAKLYEGEISEEKRPEVIGLIERDFSKSLKVAGDDETES